MPELVRHQRHYKCLAIGPFIRAASQLYYHVFTIHNCLLIYIMTTLLTYLNFIGGPALLPDTPPSNKEVLQFLAYVTRPTLKGRAAITHVVAKILEKHVTCTVDPLSNLSNKLVTVKRKAMNDFKITRSAKREECQKKLNDTPFIFTNQISCPADKNDSDLLTVSTSPTIPCSETGPVIQIENTKQQKPSNMSVTFATADVIEVGSHSETMPLPDNPSPESQPPAVEPSPAKMRPRPSVSELVVYTDCESDDCDDEWVPKTPTPKKRPYNKMDLDVLNLLMASENLPNKKSSRIFTFVSHAVGTPVVVTEKKCRGIRHRKRTDACDSLRGTEVTCLIFDGRKDKDTLVADGRATRTATEDHYSIVSEPGGHYLGFSIPETGTGIHIAESVLAHCRELEINLDNLNTLGCDGTATNTGWKIGALKTIEHTLGRPFQRAICSLHRIELPFRHLFCHLDGVTSGPKSFSGPLGRLLTSDSIHQLPVVEFIPLDEGFDFYFIPKEVVKHMSWDQKLLYRLAEVVNTGEIPPTLPATKIGNVCHSRWITLQSRVLRLYISEETPSYELRRLAMYVVSIYMPLHLKIKLRPCLSDGPLHFVEELKLVKQFGTSNADEYDILKNILQYNGYFAHPENLLLTMLCDSRRQMRKRAVDVILKIRETVTDGIRDFILPNINVDADSYDELCEFELCDNIYKFKSVKENMINVPEPPLTRGLSNRELKRLIIRPFTIDHPCHGQSVERAVKLTTLVTKGVTGRLRQIADGIAYMNGKKVVPSSIKHSDWDDEFMSRIRSL